MKIVEDIKSLLSLNFNDCFFSQNDINVFTFTFLGILIDYVINKDNNISFETIINELKTYFTSICNILDLLSFICIVILFTIFYDYKAKQ